MRQSIAPTPFRWRGIDDHHDGHEDQQYLDVNSGAATGQDVEAQRKSGTLGYAMGRTLSHELTHYLETAAAEAYAKYSQAVKAALKTKGQDFAMLMREKMDRAIQDGRKLTMQGAAAEVIADASEYMLQDSKFTNNLDTTVKGKIKAFIQNFAQKVKDIFRNLTGGHKESAALRELKDGVYHYMEGLQELWDAGFVEILDKGTDDLSAGDTESVEGQGVEYSPRDDSIIEEQPYHSEQQKRTIEAYHEAVNYDMLEAAQLYEDNPGANDQRIVTSVANAREIEDIKKLTGQDVTGYRHTANRSFFTHVAKRHGVNGEADSSMKKLEDVARVGWVINNYDSIEVLKDSNGDAVQSKGYLDKDGNMMPMIRYTKKIDGTMYIVEAVGENKYKRLWLVSAYIKKPPRMNRRA